MSGVESSGLGRPLVPYPEPDRRCAMFQSRSKTFNAQPGMHSLSSSAILMARKRRMQAVGQACPRSLFSLRSHAGPKVALTGQSSKEENGGPRTADNYAGDEVGSIITVSDCSRDVSLLRRTTFVEYPRRRSFGRLCAVAVET